jgi:hypothetical protein
MNRARICQTCNVIITGAVACDCAVQKSYTVQFHFTGDKDDLRAMEKYFSSAMTAEMNISAHSVTIKERMCA